MTKLFVIDWIIELVGAAIWIYGYFVTGHPPLINWRADTPWWIADWLPNLASEIGMVLVFAAIVPKSWRQRR